MRKIVIALIILLASSASAADPSIDRTQQHARMSVMTVGGAAPATGGSTGTITYVKSASNNGADNVTLTGVTAGNLVVVVFMESEQTGDTLTCSDGTSSLTNVTNGNGTYTVVQFFYILSANGGDRTYTISGENGSAIFTAAYEFSYTGTISYDTQNHNLGDGTGSITTGNITTGGDTAVVIVAANSYAGGDLTSQQIGGQSPTAIIDSPAGNLSIWYRIGAVSNGQGTATDPSSGYWTAQIVSFKVD